MQISSKNVEINFQNWNNYLIIRLHPGKLAQIPKNIEVPITTDSITNLLQFLIVNIIEKTEIIPNGTQKNNESAIVYSGLGNNTDPS